MKEIGVALIGHRFMGKAHSNAYRQVVPFLQPRLTPRMKVLCGRDAKDVARAAKDLGWEEWATDWREVVKRKDIDLVDVSTPGDSHAEIAIAAARAGKAVLCEKPLANTLREAEAMLKAVQKAGVVHMVCHNYRRIPAVMLAKKLIEAGEIGTVHHFRGTYLQDWILDPELPLLWRFQKEKAGSGALGDIASHSLDLGRYLVGGIPDELDLVLHDEPGGIWLAGCDQPDRSRGFDPLGMNCGRQHYLAVREDGAIWAAWADAEGVAIVPAPREGQTLPPSLVDFQENHGPPDDDDTGP